MGFLVLFFPKSQIFPLTLCHFLNGSGLLRSRLHFNTSFCEFLVLSIFEIMGLELKFLNFILNFVAVILTLIPFFSNTNTLATQGKKPRLVSHGG